MTSIKSYIITGAICLVVGIIIGILLKSNYPNSKGGILQNRDSIGFEEVMHDTTIKVIEKIVWKQSTPKVVYIQKIDSVFIELMKDYDLMTKVIKNRNGDLILYIYNQNGKILKRMEFENVGNSFEVTSQKNDIFVKSKWWDWNGINFKSRLTTPINENWKNELVLDNGLYTGFNILNRLDLNVGIGYNKQTKFNMNLETNYRIK